jgi:hypothetical protein
MMRDFWNILGQITIDFPTGMISLSKSSIQAIFIQTPNKKYLSINQNVPKIA